MTNLRGNQDELPILAELAGVNANPKVHRAIIALLNNGMPPAVIYKMLKLMRKNSVHTT